MAVGDVGVHLLEAAGVYEGIDPLPGRPFSLGVLALDGLGTAAQPGIAAAAQQFVVQIAPGHGSSWLDSAIAAEPRCSIPRLTAVVYSLPPVGQGRPMRI